MALQLSDTDARAINRQTVIGHHDLATNPLFSDESLIGILENHPAEHLFALTMGDDPTRSSDNERLVHTGQTGQQLLDAVTKGRLWLNITKIDEADERFRALTDSLYAEVANYAPEMAGIETHSTLLISSPKALVYFHVDGPGSFLWHIRGGKRVWVYPALDERLAKRELLEDIFAGVRQEYVPYEMSFDDAAEVFDLEPGEVIMWPPNSPHRVTNLDSVNVSLVTDHYTTAGRARARVYKANRFLRTRFHVPTSALSTKPSGPIAFAKVGIHKVGSAAKLDVGGSKAHRPATRRVDASSPNAISNL